MDQSCSVFLSCVGMWIGRGVCYAQGSNLGETSAGLCVKVQMIPELSPVFLSALRGIWWRHQWRIFYSVPFAFVYAWNAQGWPGLSKAIRLGVTTCTNKLNLWYLPKYHVQPELTISRQHLEIFRKGYTRNWGLYSLAF